MSYKITFKSRLCVLVNSDITANTAGLDDFIEDERKGLVVKAHEWAELHHLGSEAV